MKANAPEKIFLHPDIGGKEFISSWLRRRANNESVEYTRTDVFIDKETEWLRKELCNYFDAPREDFERFIEDLKKTMRL